MRVFRQQYTDRNGQTKESQNWYVEIRDHQESIKRIPGFTDKAATTELGRKLTRLVSARIAHDPPSAELIRWIEGLPTRLRARIAELGLVDSQSSVTGKTLSDHLKDFEQNLKDRNRTSAYCKLVTTRIQSILDDCGFRQLSDIAAVRVEGFLAKLKSNGRSQQTMNDYLTATKTFLNWMVSNRRLSANPLGHMSGGNVKVDRRLERRELDEGEIRWLLNTTQAHRTVYGLTGWERFTLYSVALGTGLRASELASLTPQSFDLTTDPPTVTINAKSEKARRGDTLPLPPDLAKLLKDWLRSVETDAKLWPGKWAEYKSASKFLQSDLTAARSEWLKTAESDEEREAMGKTDFLSYRDDDGRQADFHALRHTFLSRLGRSGASPKVMQRLARHSTVGLTLDRYTHAGLYDLQAAVEKLPPLPTTTGTPREIQSARATGTDAADTLPTVLPSCLPKRVAKTRVSVPFSAVSKGDLTPTSDDTKNEKTVGKTEVSSTVHAERGGFEPPVEGIPRRRFSKAVTSSRKEHRQEEVTSNGLRVLPSSLPDSVETDPDLVRVIRAWPTLAEPLRRAILAMIGATNASELI